MSSAREKWEARNEGDHPLGKVGLCGRMGTFMEEASYYD